MKRVFYVYNPFSGQGAGAQMLDAVLERCMRANVTVTPHRLFTMKPDLALEAFFETQARYYDAILVAGGDGTLWQMLNVAQRHDCHLPLGLLPMGTCNDTVRSLGLPADFYKCLDYYIDCIHAGQSFAIDLGRITARQDTSPEQIYFLNSVAGGVFVDVSHKTKPELKKVFGPLAYYFSAIGSLADMRPFRLRIETEDEVFDESVLLFLLLNGNDVAGFSDVIDRADMRDGYMDILIVRDGKVWESLHAGLQIVRVLKNAKTIRQIRCRRARIIADPAPTVSIDGERGTPLPYTVEMLPLGLRLVGRQTVPSAVGQRPQSLGESPDHLSKTFAEYLAKAWTTSLPRQNADGTYTVST